MRGLSVTLTAAEVRPWKEWAKAMTFFLPVWNEASFSAFSLASAPELMRKRGIVVIPRQGAQLVGQLLLQAVDNRVGVEDELLGLLVMRFT